MGFSSASSYGRIYTKTFTYEDGSRWQSGKVPCSGQTIEFNANQFVSVKVDSSASIQNMYLPMNGELIFGDNAILGTSKDLSSCTGHGETVKFNSQPDSWFNAHNWEAHNLADGNPIHVQTFLDTESVPCDFDQVTFTNGDTWTIGIPTDITVNSFTVAGQKYNTQSFSTYRTSGAGRYQFVGDGLVAINPTTCQDATGCYCRTALHYNEVAQFICSNTPCSDPRCKDAILPSGQCCAVCGGALTMSYQSDVYTETNMISFLTQQSSKFSGTHFALSKQRRTGGTGNGDDVIQVMLTDDSGNGYQAKQLAQAIMDLLSPTNNLGVSDVTIIVSGQGDNVGLTGGTIAGIVIATLLVCVFLLTAAYCYKTGGRNFKIELPTAFWKSTQQGESNPMYDMSSNEGSNDGQESPGNRDSSTTVTQQVTKDTGLPQALQSDFGVSFPNPNYLEEDL